MKKRIKDVLVIGTLLSLSAILLYGGANQAPPEKKVVVSEEVKKEFPVKSHHAELSFECVFCHEGQGDDPKQFSAPGDDGCLSCHKTKEFLAKRLEFMDKLHVNPHNSIHDGPVLFCDECHMEHEPSRNMCIECHEHDIKLWMKDTP
ncbi:cytochrome c3 family protein [Arcobacter arenosus]|uniref:Cytochrome C n=1 Tax=Arcobacter arenosus TaxID=2576037 RepID=A0A5R8XYF5_9BACT|nr:cytochrome c3 family protein [Arcobacter arenosus]TLP36914.1 cytochrome C [Arcobacter arenosus]